MRKHPAFSRIVTLALLAVAAQGPASAQRPAPVVSISAGSATDERGARWNAVTLAPSFPFVSSSRMAVTLGASATQFAAHGWQLGGGIVAAARTPEAGGAALSFNAGTGVTHTSFGTTFITGEAMPALEYRMGGFTVFGGGRVAIARTSTETPGPSPPSPAERAVASRGSVAPVYGAVWLFGSPESQVSAALSFRGEHARVEGEGVVDHTGAGAVSIGISRNVTFEAAAGQYPANRLTGTSPGRFVSAGFNFRLGGRGEPTLPAPSGVRGPAAGQTRFAIKDTDARSVELYGDWNDWSPVPARRAPNGVWYVDLTLAPGEYRYAFRINEVAWRVPEGVVTTRDGFGGRSAWVTVPRSATQVGIASREER